jgi:nitrosourea synthase
LLVLSAPEIIDGEKEPVATSSKGVGSMKTQEARHELHAYTDFHGKRLLNGTPFYKPAGTFFDLDLANGDIAHPSSMALYFGRVLLACYENEFIYVPDGPEGVDLAVWDTNYAEDKLFQSHTIRRRWEGPYFRNLLEDIHVTGDWSIQSFEDYFADYTAKLDAADSKAVVARIQAAKSPLYAAKFHAVQLSSEFLIEASGMTRNLQGYFGPEQSEYFKILNDEYGYGVHSAKHSTLYMDFLTSLQLQGRPHHYWWFYLPATLYSSNYINASCSNHMNFFRELGALTQSENSFAVSLKYFDDMYRDMFPNCNASYFREHIHIDQHHGRMAFRDVCVSLAKRAGNQLIPKMVRGFEEGMYVGKMYRKEFTAHLDWVDAIWSEIVIADGEEFSASSDFFTTMVDTPSVLTAEGGTVLVYAMPWVYRPVPAGESMTIPARMLFGIQAEKDASYSLKPMS